MTRTIVSVSGSSTHGLGSWVDNQLNDLCKKLPSYLNSSVEIKEKLLKLSSHDLSRAQLSTADIETNHAMNTIAFFCATHHYAKTSPPSPSSPRWKFSCETSSSDLEILIGYRRLVQLCGNTTCTNACHNLLCGIYELQFRPKFKSLLVYTRYIDDIFGIWIGQQC
jgi:hypothetical protein